MASSRSYAGDNKCTITKKSFLLSPNRIIETDKERKSENESVRPRVYSEYAKYTEGRPGTR